MKWTNLHYNLLTMKFIKLIILSVFFGQVYAQDIQYSQYYANPLYLNPALTGGGNNTRAILNFRDQWPNQSGKFVSYAASFDHYFSSISSGVGLLVTHDRIAENKISSTEVGLSYSYNIAINSEWSFRPGLQLGYVSRNTNFNSFTYNDQFSKNGFNGNSSADYVGALNKNYIDVGAGGLAYTDKVWIGTSFYHLTQPSQGFDEFDSKLPIKFSIHSGIKIPLIDYDPYADRMGKWKEISITPTFMYKAQGKFDQLDLGAYFHYDPIMIGLWYRGIPFIKQTGSVVNNQSIVPMLGVKTHGFSFAYSYDINLSKFTGTGGAHEISLIFDFWAGKDTREYRQPRSKVSSKLRKIPCPRH